MFQDLTEHTAFSVTAPRRRGFGMKQSRIQPAEDASMKRDSLFRSAYRQRIGPTPLLGKKVICVSPKPNCDVEQMATEMGANVMPVTTLAQAERVLRESPREWDMLFIMRDGLMPLDHLVTDLLTLRFSQSQLPVVMFSTSFMADDMTKDRSPICDASMCLPMTQGRLKMCVEAAIQNVLDKD